jgi:hypothetical protein
MTLRRTISAWRAGYFQGKELFALHIGVLDCRRQTEFNGVETQSHS